jgi:hypothetical protein
MNYSPYLPTQYEPMYRVHYKGKSNKDFTHDRVYKCFGVINTTPSDKDVLNGKNYINLTVYGNRGNMIQFNDDYYDYVNDNFVIINQIEYEQLVRKNKIKKISNKFNK